MACCAAALIEQALSYACQTDNQESLVSPRFNKQNVKQLKMTVIHNMGLLSTDTCTRILCF
jgi:hypothetical protein